MFYLGDCCTNVDNATASGQHKYAYTYDKVGNRQGMTVTDSGGTRIHVYTYDSIYQVTGVDYPPELSYLATDADFDYDAAGNRTSVEDGSGVCTYTSNDLNQYTQAGNVTYRYDRGGNLEYDGHYFYHYDGENRLTKVRRKEQGPAPLSLACDTDLVFTTGGAANWTAQTAGGYFESDCARSGVISSGQQSWMETTVTGKGTIRFYWSVSAWQYLRFYIDGQLQTEIWGPQSWTEQSYYLSSGGTHTVKWTFSQQSQEYSAWGCVDRVEWSGPLPQDPPATDWRELVYVYDAAGRRVEKKYNNVTVLKYIYDGDHCIAEYDGSNNLRRKYIYGPGVDEPVCMIEAAGSYAGTYYYHFDGLGSVVGLTNASGNTVEVYEYDVYGRLGATDASHPNRILFTGREYDKETGLYYYRARYYNPQIGRFLQTDPKGYGDGMNPYRYCANNPLSATDPSGEEFVLVPPFVPVPRVDEWVKEWWHNLMKRAANLGRPDYPGDWDTLLPFARWYFWQDTDNPTVNLEDVGLLEKLKARVSEGIREFEKTVVNTAKAFAREMLRKGAYMDQTTVTGSIGYDFAPGVFGYAYHLVTLDPFFVLGSGSVKATATIRAERVSANTAKWTATVEYDVNDEFKDPLNPTNKPGNFELAGGKPCPITAHWEQPLAGTVTVN